MEEIKTKEKWTFEIVDVSPELKVTVLELPSIEYEEEELYFQGKKVYKPIFSTTRWIPFTVSFAEYYDMDINGLFEWISTFNMGIGDGTTTGAITRTGILKCSNGQVWEIENIWPQSINTLADYSNSEPLKIELTFSYSRARVDYSNTEPQNNKISLNWDNK